MSVVNNSFLSAYESQTADLQQQLNSLLDKDSIAFQTKEKANQIVEGIGSLKAFVSGQPVGKFLIQKGKAYIKDAMEKQGLKEKDAEEATEDEPEGTVAEPSEIPNPAFNPAEVESAEDLPDMLASKAEPLVNNYGESSTVAETSVDDASSSADVLAGESDLISKVSQITKDDFTLAKSEFEEGVGEGAGEGAGELAGEETTDEAVTSEIPIVNIIGLVVGAGLAIGAAVKKPKFSPPADNINASYQVGI